MCQVGIYTSSRLQECTLYIFIIYICVCVCVLHHNYWLSQQSGNSQSILFN